MLPVEAPCDMGPPQLIGPAPAPPGLDIPGMAVLRAELAARESKTDRIVLKLSELIGERINMFVEPGEPVVPYTIGGEALACAEDPEVVQRHEAFKAVCRNKRTQMRRELAAESKHRVGNEKKQRRFLNALALHEEGLTFAEAAQVAGFPVQGKYVAPVPVPWKPYVAAASSAINEYYAVSKRMCPEAGPDVIPQHITAKMKQAARDLALILVDFSMNDLDTRNDSFLSQRLPKSWTRAKQENCLRSAVIREGVTRKLRVLFVKTMRACQKDRSRGLSIRCLRKLR